MEQAKQEVRTDFGNGVTREMLHDGRVAVYTIDKMTRAGLDSWVEASANTLTYYSKAQTQRAIHHVNSLAAMISPYATQSIRRVAENAKEYQGYTAIVIQKSMAAQLLEIVMRQISRVTQKWTIRFFTDKDKALAWLLESPDK